MTARLALRVDANGEIGAGHLMRCLALAQAWQDTGGECTFLLRDTAAHFVERLRREAMGILILPDDDPHTAVAHASRLRSDWLVLDGYRFDSNYQAALAAGPIPVLALDDNGEAGRYTARLVLNQNGHAFPALYADKAPDVELLLGLEYTLLRREFRQAAPRQRPCASVRHALVTLGASDESRVISSVVAALVAEIEATATCTLVTDNFVPQASTRIAVCHRVEDMAALMTQADFAVTAGGSTLLEAAALALPALPLVLADNQQNPSHRLAELDACFSPVHSLDVLRDRLHEAVWSQEHRARISERGVRLIDRQGATRVVSRMQAMSL